MIEETLKVTAKDEQGTKGDRFKTSEELKADLDKSRTQWSRSSRRQLKEYGQQGLCKALLG